MALLVHKFLQSGYPKYFEPFLKPRDSVYRTCRSQSDGMLLEVAHFASIYKSKKHFGHSFAYNAPRIWNDQPDDVHSVRALSSSRKKLKSVSLCKNILNLVFGSYLGHSLWQQPLQCSSNDLCFLALCTLESVNRWRLSSVKVLLELELDSHQGALLKMYVFYLHLKHDRGTAVCVSSM